MPPPQFDAEAVSNVSTIALFSAPHSGLFALLNEECVFPKGTDESFVTKLHAANKEHSRLSVLQPEGSAFRVAHYAGIVTYKAKGFLVKNKARARLLPRPPLTRRRSPPHVRSRRPSRRTCSSSSAPQATGPAPAAPRRHLNSSSSCRLPPSPQASPSSQRSSRKRRPRLRRVPSACACALVPSAGAFVLEARGRRVGMTPERSSRQVGKRGGRGFRGVVGGYAAELDELLRVIRSSTAHFVRCIKPNVRKAARCFEEPVVMRQLRCGGVLEAVRVFASGFPDRMPIRDFVGTYCSVVAPSKLPPHPPGGPPSQGDAPTAWERGACAAILRAFDVGKDSNA